MTRMDFYGAMMAFSFVFALFNMMDRAWFPCAIWTTAFLAGFILLAYEAA